MKIYITISMVTIFLLLSIGSAMAATLSVSGPERDAMVGENFSVDVVLITLGEQVNAVEGEVLYDRGLLYVEEIREDGSTIGLWLTRPYKAELGMVRFSGVIPGGSPSARTHILTLVFKPLATGNARVWFHNTRAFLNDGAGTPVPLSFEDYRVSVLENIPDNLRVPDRAASSSPIVVEDHESPLPFQPELGRDESVYEGKWFLSFSATDKMSGIDYYMVYEGPKVQKSDVPEWIRVESPYLIQDQTLQSYIYVRAVDRVGNERVAIVEPEIRTNWFVWIIIGVIVLLAVVGWKKIRMMSFPSLLSRG